MGKDGTGRAYGSGRESVASTFCTYSVDENGFGSAEVAYDNGTTGDFAFATAGRGRKAFLLTAAEGEILPGLARRQ